MKFGNNHNLTVTADTVYVDLNMVTGLDTVFVDSDTKVIFNQRPEIAISPSNYLSNYKMSIGSLARHLGLSVRKTIDKPKQESFHWFCLLNKLFRI